MKSLKHPLFTIPVLVTAGAVYLAQAERSRADAASPAGLTTKAPPAPEGPDAPKARDAQRDGGPEGGAIPTDPAVLKARALEVMSKYCMDCHGAEQQKGEMRFDRLDDIDPVKLPGILELAQETVHFEEMPPPKKPQPSAAERELLLAWFGSQLTGDAARKLQEKLAQPEAGNYVDHEDLFSGEYADLPGFTRDRRWLISEFIFDAKFQRILRNRTVGNFGGARVDVLGGHNIRDVSLANPFLLPEKAGVRYYANVDLTGGHLSTMLGNAQKASAYMTDYLVTRDRSYVPAINQIMALETEHAATLAKRKAFLDDFIAKVCEEVYGQEHAAMLPEFVPVVLNEGEGLDTDPSGKSKLLPPQVAFGFFEKAGGIVVFTDVVMNPANADKTAEQIAEICERTWFYAGDFERDIQGRLALIRDYFEAFRERVRSDPKKFKPREYKPLDEAEMEVVRAAIREHRAAGDRYNQVIDKMMADWDAEFTQQRIAAGPPTGALLAELVGQLFVEILERSPSAQETEDYVALTQGYIEKLGKRTAIQKLIQTLLLSSEFVYRSEFGVGEADEHGRRMMSPRDASYAIAYALTDQPPDAELVKAAEEGRLNTRDDYRREVSRILAQRDRYYQIDKMLADRWREDNITNMPIRELRFFREFFGYPKALTIFKDEKRFGGDRLDYATNRLLGEADRIVAHILEEDQDVFEQLLTTEDFYIYHDGDNERMQARSDEIGQIYEYFKDKDWQNFTKDDLLSHADFLRTVNMRMVDPDKPDASNRQGDMLKLFKMSMTTIVDRMDNGQKQAAPFDLYRGYGNDFMPGYNVGKFWNYDLDNWDYATVQPAPVPNRKGMLTHPAWLIAHAFNTETDPIHRGKWVREKLLADTIPDVPITVDAQIPEDHGRTLRDRLAGATETEDCWRCHVYMNPLGYAFEMYDDFGRFRTVEGLEYPDKLIKEGPDQRGNHLVDTRNTYQTLPVDSTGYLEGTRDDALDGPVTGAIDLTERLARSERVRQSIIRHAFRYFMGRNETLNDSKTLIDAERAYVESGGSFDAVIVSLLTSDSFIYRKPIED